VLALGVVWENAAIQPLLPTMCELVRCTMDEACDVSATSYLPFRRPADTGYGTVAGSSTNLWSSVTEEPSVPQPDGVAPSCLHSTYHSLIS